MYYNLSIHSSFNLFQIYLTKQLLNLQFKIHRWYDIIKLIKSKMLHASTFLIIKVKYLKFSIRNIIMYNDFVLEVLIN